MEVAHKRTRSTSPPPTKVRVMADKNEPDTDMDDVEAQKVKAQKNHMESEMERGKIEQYGTGGGKKLSLPRQPGIGSVELIFDARMFLTMYVFRPVLGAFQANVSPDYTVLLALFPCYTFNTSNLGLYLDKAAIERLEAMMKANLNIRVKNIAGSLKSIGVTAPFVTAADGQSSTNSQLTATALVGYGLERRTNMLEGTVTLAHDKPQVTGFDSSEEYYADSYIPSQTLGGQNKLADMEHENAFCQFKEYRTVSAQYVTLDGVPLAPSVNAQVNYTKHMTSVDLTESQGEILAWNYNMTNTFVSTGIDPRRVPNYHVSPDFVVNSGTGSPSASATVTAATYDTTTTPEAFGNVQSWYLTHNNATKIGTAGGSHQVLPPKAYLHLVPPPTIQPQLIQDYFVSTVLDTTIVFEAFGSATLPDYNEDAYAFVLKSNYAGFRNSCLDGGPGRISNTFSLLK